MKLTALEEYGLRCILHLARKRCGEPADTPPATSPGGSLTLGEIASEEGLTQQYAGKIFRVLAKAGLVESERGRKGGYRLTRRPEEISLSEVLCALGGRFFDRQVCGRYRGDRASCVHLAGCAIRSVWMEVQSVVNGVLEQCTLRDLVDKERAMAEALEGLPEGVVYVTPEGRLGSMPFDRSAPERPRAKRSRGGPGRLEQTVRGQG